MHFFLKINEIPSITKGFQITGKKSANTPRFNRLLTSRSFVLGAFNTGISDNICEQFLWKFFW